jgi:hypothetical protein
MEENNLIVSTESVEAQIKNELKNLFESKRSRIFSKIMGAALGTIPWIGGFLSAAISYKSEEGQAKRNELYEQWLSEHDKKIKTLQETLINMLKRFNEFPEDIDERLESEEYLQIIRKGFRVWDNSDTTEKQNIVRKLMSNAGTSKLVPDDLISLFLDWINLYHETHFAVIKEIYKTPGITRYEIWQNLNGTDVREDSLEADLFKLLIRDLSMGSVIRQERPTDYHGNFVKKAPAKKKSSNSSSTFKSAFDSTEGYELTELGSQFVHYTMNEVVSRIE